MPLKRAQDHNHPSRELELDPVFSREPLTVPRHALPRGEMEPETAYQPVHDELVPDGNARLNLATFASTWAEPELPGRRHAHVRAQLLPPGRPRRRPVLQLPAPGLRRLPARAADLPRRRHPPGGRDRRAGTVRTDHRRQPDPGPRLPGPRRDRRLQRLRRSAALRERGWLVPAYTFPENRTDLSVLRIVARNGFGHDLADLLLADLKRVLERLERQNGPQREADDAGGFAHGAETRNPKRPGRN